jgi:hypothetical protein
MDMKTAAVALAILTGLLGGFYGGYRVGNGRATSAATPSPAAQAAQALLGRQAAGLPGGQGAGAQQQAPCPSPGAAPAAGPALVTGTITKVAGTTVTVHDTRCNTDVAVTLDASAQIRKTVSGQAADIQENQIVSVQGQRQGDGSLRARSVTLVPPGANPGAGR